MKAYTIREDKYLRANHGTKSITQMAAELGRSRDSVKNYLQRMGLKLKPKHAAEIKRRAGFKKGQVQPRKTNAAKPTSFKPGHVPHNKRQDGDITSKLHGNGKRYQYLRYAGRWVLYHRHTWIASNGPIPSGHVIVFRDGNTMNADIDNLECITIAAQFERNRDRNKAAETRKLRAKAKRWLRDYKANNPEVIV